MTFVEFKISCGHCPSVRRHSDALGTALFEAIIYFAFSAINQKLLLRLTQTRSQALSYSLTYTTMQKTEIIEFAAPLLTLFAVPTLAGHDYFGTPCRYSTRHMTMSPLYHILAVSLAQQGLIMNSEKPGPIFFNHQWNYDGITASNLNPVRVFSILQSNRKFYHFYTAIIVIQH